MESPPPLEYEHEAEEETKDENKDNDEDEKELCSLLDNCSICQLPLRSDLAVSPLFELSLERPDAALSDTVLWPHVPFGVVSSERDREGMEGKERGR